MEDSWYCNEDFEDSALFQQDRIHSKSLFAWDIWRWENEPFFLIFHWCRIWSSINLASFLGLLVNFYLQLDRWWGKHYDLQGDSLNQQYCRSKIHLLPDLPSISWFRLDLLVFFIYSPSTSPISASYFLNFQVKTLFDFFYGHLGWKLQFIPD